MTIYVGMDDTDMPGTRGTGKLANSIVKVLDKKYPSYAITRHQLFVSDDIKYTSHNSNAVIHVNASGEEACKDIFEIVKAEMLADFIEGSDPGLAVADAEQILPPVIVMSQDTKYKVITQEQVKTVAKNTGILLEPLGGTGDGIIGAMAGLGLACTNDDGRYLLKDNLRKIRDSTDVEELLKSGVDSVYLPDGREVKSGIIRIRENQYPKPSPVCGKSVLFVNELENGEYKAYMRR